MSGDYARYEKAVAALERIAADPAETPARRERARKALIDDRAERTAWARGGGSRPRHNTSGDAYARTLGAEEGWGERR
ncbi:MAG: hypothetical protein ACYC1Z_03485 [Georgenia sp.]